MLQNPNLFEALDKVAGHVNVGEGARLADVLGQSSDPVVRGQQCGQRCALVDGWRQLLDGVVGDVETNQLLEAGHGGRERGHGVVLHIDVHQVLQVGQSFGQTLQAVVLCRELHHQGAQLFVVVNFYWQRFHVGCAEVEKHLRHNKHINDVVCLFIEGQSLRVTSALYT